MWQEYIIAANLSDVFDILNQQSQRTRLVAGATDLLLEIKRGAHADIDTLIDITHIPGLNKITIDDANNIHIGALVTHNDCIGSSLIRDYAYPLARACWEVGSPQIRNRGTVAGNIITASPANDTIAPLVALNAKIVLQSKHSKRVLPLSDFYTGVRKTIMQPDEMLVEIFFHRMESNQKGTFYKLALRRAQAISIVNAAVILTLEKGTIKSAQITLGAVAPTIVHAFDSEKYLEGRTLENSIIEKAGDLAANEAKPISDIRSSLAYRKLVIKTIVKRTLRILAENQEMVDFPSEPVLLRKNICERKISETITHNGMLPIINKINGINHEFIRGHNKTLLQLLRDDSKLTGTKEGCGEGECGACTVFLDGRAVMSCLVPAAHTHGAKIITIEGLAVEGHLHPVQQSFINEGAVQCGYCTPGFIMSAVKMLEEYPSPSKEQICQGITGNLCRCTGYYKIVSAIERTILGG